MIIRTPAFLCGGVGDDDCFKNSVIEAAAIGGSEAESINVQNTIYAQ